MLKKQGINGPPPSFLLGNIKEIKAHFSVSKLQFSTNQAPVLHNCSSYIFHCFEQWKNQYGPSFVFSLGNLQVLYVNEPEMVKEITTCTCLDFGKPTYQQRDRGPLLGQGILTSNGTVWSHQRKILAPQLYMDKVKGMANLIAESSMNLVNSWKIRIEKGGTSSDFKIDQELRNFSGDVISRACFGSNYSKGEMIFLKLKSLQEAMSKKTLSTGIPALRHFPTKSNREIWSLEKEIRHLVLDVAKERQERSDRNHEDLLQMVIEGAENSRFSKEEMERFIVDNCKNIYLAGYETTAVSSTWTLMLLAANPDWQDLVRAEVVEICGDRVPDYDMLRQMKQLNMVIQESLRLYPPVTVIS
ncbi:Cytochrome P450 714C2 [Euphorbia peplus]|nr:Cytochrome P450 714C2 [Euphorbia peplus]